MTERGLYVFYVKEYASGQPFIAADPRLSDSGIPALRRFDLGFDLTEGMSHYEAQAVAEYLNRHITSITYTLPNRSD